MNKKALFSHILATVSAITDVSTQRITGRARDTESTDARYIVATLLHERGFYPTQIAEFLGRTPRSIRWLLSRQTSPMLLIYLSKARPATAALA